MAYLWCKVCFMFLLLRVSSAMIKATASHKFVLINNLFSHLGRSYLLKSILKLTLYDYIFICENDYSKNKIKSCYFQLLLYRPLCN